MVLPSLLFLQPLLAGEPVRFPKDAGVLDITAAPYNAIANDGKDDTTAIQKAIGALWKIEVEALAGTLSPQSWRHGRGSAGLQAVARVVADGIRGEAGGLDNAPKWGGIRAPTH